MNEQREALAEALAEHLRGGWDDSDAREAGDYLAPLVVRLLADAEQRGAARVTAAVETVCDEVSDATRGSLDEAQSFGGALVGAVNIYSDGFDRIRAALTPAAAQDPA